MRFLKRHRYSAFVSSFFFLFFFSPLFSFLDFCSTVPLDDWTNNSWLVPSGSLILRCRDSPPGIESRFQTLSFSLCTREKTHSSPRDSFLPFEHGQNTNFPPSSQPIKIHFANFTPPPIFRRFAPTSLENSPPKFATRALPSK